MKLFAAALILKLALVGFLIGWKHDDWADGFQNPHYDDVGYYQSACGLLIIML